MNRIKLFQDPTHDGAPLLRICRRTLKAMGQEFSIEVLQVPGDVKGVTLPSLIINGDIIAEGELEDEEAVEKAIIQHFSTLGESDEPCSCRHCEGHCCSDDEPCENCAGDCRDTHTRISSKSGTFYKIIGLIIIGIILFVLAKTISGK